MADLIRIAHYFKITIPDKSGTLAHMLGLLHDAGVTLLAVHAFPRNRRTQVDVVSEDPAAFKEAVKPLKWRMQGPKVCFLVDGDDRPGAMVALTNQLASAKINLTAVTATTAGQGRFGAIVWVKTRDIKKSAKVLGIR
ncbi:MAG: hypothetical protein QM706_18895 [Nitrospira sp.]